MVEGKVIQIAGPAIDIQFLEGQIPVINTAVHITSEGFTVPTPIDVMVEVAQHIGEGRVRAIALQPTDGMVRGMKAVSLGHPIEVPVGNQTLGRVMNVIGQPVDNMGPVNTAQKWPIHRAAPALRLSICWNPISAAARSASSVAPAWARPWSSWSSSTTSP
jgi:F-type H+-transporting ATPase subunit beta